MYIVAKRDGGRKRLEKGAEKARKGRGGGALSEYTP